MKLSDSGEAAEADKRGVNSSVSVSQQGGNDRISSGVRGLQDQRSARQELANLARRHATKRIHNDGAI